MIMFTPEIMKCGGILSSGTRLATLPVLVACLCLVPQAQADSRVEVLPVQAAGFTLATNHMVSTGTKKFILSLSASNAPRSFCQSAVKQDTAPALQGPDPRIPYFTVRFALPIPPENATRNLAALTGINPLIFTHNHSPGLEILPNGDALAVWFSTPPGESESANTTTFIQARLRYGSEEWDMPGLFMDFKKLNDQSALLWRDGKKIWFFGGGRGLSSWIPFKIATSTDNGETWTLSLPLLNSPASDFTPQPITSAFRAPDGTMYFAMDGHGAHSFLWRSADDGVHWHEMSGRTGGRHSVIVSLDEKGDLLSIGGKNSSVDGWSPENFSTNWGASWSQSKPSPFPPLGSGQRPSLIRLADGNLFFVSDAWLQKADKPPPPGWKFGDGCFVAISTNNGTSWRIKPLPVQLPNHSFRKYGTVGYVVARQAPNGVIHILTSETQPCLDYELNEAWIFSDAGDIAPENSGGVIKHYSEKYPNGKLRSTWSARICPHGRYLLDGLETDYYPDGRKEHVVTYRNGLKTGTEIFWGPNGGKLWSWENDLKHHTGVWIHYWPNGRKKVESTWNTRPHARDLGRSFFGLVANGPFYQWNENGRPARAGWFANGIYAGTRPLPPAQP
jgi:antitoxin component YwqK of YwqJK toxin-antitoxin module